MQLFGDLNMGILRLIAAYLVLAAILGKRAAAELNPNEQCTLLPTDKKSLFYRLSRKIAGGNEAEEGRYPYTVSIQTFSTHRHMCGGMLIAQDLVLTAAHCVDPGEPNAEQLPYLLIGAHNLKLSTKAEAREACRTIMHKKYRSLAPQDGFDVALIELNQSSAKTPLKLDATGRHSKSGAVRAMGWGRNQHNKYPIVLQELDLTTVPNPQCGEQFGFGRGQFPPALMCAREEGKDVCAGDSGGPLIKPGSGCGENDVLVGLVSFGASCVDPDYGLQFPGVYTRISSHIDWINTRGRGDSVIFTSDACSNSDFEIAGEREEEKSTVPPPAKDSGGCVFVEGVDFNGGVHSMNKGNEDVFESPQECCSLCKTTPGCVVWTYFRIAIKYHPKGACFLRAVHAPATRCSMCTSGLVKEESLNTPEEECAYFLGMNFEDPAVLTKFETTRVENCCKACKANKGCKSYVLRNGMCYLKPNIPKFSVCSDCQAGILKSRVTEDHDVGPILELIPSFAERIQNLNLTTIKSECRMTVGVDLKSPFSVINDGKKDKVESPEACCNLCKQRQDCRSWTFFRVATRNQPQGSCWLRNDVPYEVPCAACTSGVVEGQGVSELDPLSCGVLEGADLFGSDIPDYRPINTDSPKACCNLCMDTKGCKSWTRVKKDGICFLKNKAAPAPVMCSACDSGIVLSKVTRDEIKALDPVITKR